MKSRRAGHQEGGEMAFLAAHDGGHAMPGEFIP